jgi:hypothetical protein
MKPTATEVESSQAPAARHYMTENIHKWLILRLVLAWFVLSLVIGGLVHHFGNVRLDNHVVNMAKTETAIYTEAWRSYLESPSERSLAVFNGRIQSAIENGNMIAIEFYDSGLYQIAGAIKASAREIAERLPEHSYEFARQSAISCEKVELGKDSYLRVFVPIRNSAGIKIGYLEGIYHAPGQIVTQIKQETYWSLVLVVLVVFSTSLVLYPIIIRLNRNRQAGQRHQYTQLPGDALLSAYRRKVGAVPCRHAGSDQGGVSA